MDGPKRLHRSRTDKMIGGVCGGLGEYFNIDPTIIRILWVVLAVVPLPGSAILAYIILWIIMPPDPAPPLPPSY